MPSYLVLRLGRGYCDGDPMNASRNTNFNKSDLSGQKISFGLFEWIRFRFLKHLYEAIFLFLMRDTSWQEPLFASIERKTQCRVLTFGRGAISVARALAVRLPEANVIGADPNPKAIKTALRRVVRRNIPNLTIVEASRCGRLPFAASSFDKVVLVLAFHNCIPEEKLEVAKEMLRVLRHGGTLHVAAYDKPSLSGERALLAITRYLSGPTAAESHLDGSWIEFLTKAGFAGIRRQASCSVVGARISVVRARKP